MEYVLPIAAVLLFLAVLLLFYFNRKKATPLAVDDMTDQESVAETTESEPKPETDPYIDLLPHVSEVENEETVKSRYKKIEIPAFLKWDILQTLSAGAMVVRDQIIYKVEFSPEVVKGLKDKSVTLMQRGTAKGISQP